MATKKQIQIAVLLAINEYVHLDLEERTDQSIAIELLATTAQQYGARWGVTFTECKDMLEKPLFEVVSNG
jgi:hypothetical protein